MSKLKCCPRGHFYDEERHAVCPYCQTTTPPDQSPPGGNFGSSQSAGGGYGSYQSVGNDPGVTQPMGGVSGTSQSAGNFGTSQSTGGNPGVTQPVGGGFGTAQSSGNFGTSQPSGSDPGVTQSVGGGFGTAQSTGDPGVTQPIGGGFGSAQPYNFGTSQPSGGAPGATQPISGQGAGWSGYGGGQVKAKGKFSAVHIGLIAAIAAAAIFLVLWLMAENTRREVYDSYLDKADQVWELQKQVEALTEEAATFDSLRELYGYGSETYYAGSPVLVLEAGGEDGRLPIYFGLSGTVSMKRSDSAITTAWSQEWADDWTDVIVTPSDSAGFYTIHFTNDQDSSAFDVLVIVQ